MFNRKRFSVRALLFPAVTGLLAFSTTATNAAVLRHSPTSPQPAT
jgi:hypothetical protein